MSTATSRYTLRDLPLPAKLVVTTFLISVGLGYLWAMAQIHFKHASPGNPLPTVEDLVARFSGVPWPLEPKPEPGDEAADDPGKPKGEDVLALRIKTVIDSRCARCHMPGEEKEEFPLNTYAGIARYLVKSPEHPKGQMHTVVTGNPARRGKTFSKKDMVEAFFERSIETINGVEKEWPKLTAEQRNELTPKREAERLALLEWIEAGGPQKQYEADAFPLPGDDRFKSLPAAVRTMAAPLAPAGNGQGRQPRDKWASAKSHQLDLTALTQSTHAHLLSFSVLWALTGLVFAFSSYSSFLRCTLSPLVLVAQVADVACWWLARLDGVGPYFALAILGTGTVVGLGLMSQIILSLFNMYGPKGKRMLFLLFLAGAGLFGLTYVKVIAPQIQAERDFVQQQQAN